MLGIFLPEEKDVINSIQTIQNAVNNQIATYEMTDEEIENLASTEIIEQTVAEEDALEQEVEDEGFQLQGEIAYEGDKAVNWDVTLGDYIGLTYYSQIDSRWRYLPYTSIGDPSQTIGSSGCGPTSAAMIVTATKGAITPDTMANLFVRYGYRSPNNGTYWSAFRAIADEFNITYQETTNFNTAMDLLRNNRYVVASVGNGLFTTGGHFIVLVGIDGNTIKIYDPYLYAGKFDTATRRGKVTVGGNTVYCSADNFRNYANAQGFFCYLHEGNVQPTPSAQPVVTSTYTRVVSVRTALNVRNAPNGRIVGSLKNDTQVTVYETNGSWARIGTNRWVSSNYLVQPSIPVATKPTYRTAYATGSYRVTASVLNVRTGPRNKL